jgi:hypothetical protein
MRKEDTQVLKGIAILMMLWLHLFADLDWVEQCRWLLPYFNGKPLIHTLTRIASSCVPIYIFLGGYGLACVWQQAPLHHMGTPRRALALMTNFWVVCLLFIPLGCIINPTRFPESITTLLLNLTGISYSYNGAWWFLLPYVLLTLCSPLLIRRIMGNHLRTDLLMLVPLFIIHVGAYIAAENMRIPDASPLHAAFPACNFLFMLFFFSVGVLFVKYGIFQRIVPNVKRLGKTRMFLLMILLCVKMFLGNTSLLNLPFVLLLLPLLLSLDLPHSITATLQFFGRHSTNMWLTHFFFAYYIFGGEIYRLQYPLLIFAALVAVSLLSSYIVQAIFTPLRHLIRKD